MSEIKKEKPRHLGRGLASLLNPMPVHTAQEVVTDRQAVSETAQVAPKFPPDLQMRESFREISLSFISPNPYQPRTQWDEAALNELSQSIKANGLVHPIILRQNGTNFEIIAGERRFRAVQMLGWEKVHCIVRKATDEQMHELALVENINRSDLNPVEIAKAYQRYVQSFNLTQAEAAQRLGEDRSVVANYLRLLDLPEDIKNMLSANQLSMGHARAILGLPTDELRRKLANRALAGRLSVREVERLVKKFSAEPAEAKVSVNIKAPNVIDLENRLRRELGTRVSIAAKRSGQKGKIIIEFNSVDEFERIAQRLGVDQFEEV